VTGITTDGDLACQLAPRSLRSNPFAFPSRRQRLMSSVRLRQGPCLQEVIMSTRVASCSCGQLQAEVQGEPLRVYVCHCLACQKRTGSVFGEQARFDKSRLKVTGKITEYVRIGDKGTKFTFRFCPKCGATVYYTSEGREGIVGIPVGAFGEPGFPPPTASFYERRRHPWLRLPVRLEHVPWCHRVRPRQLCRRKADGSGPPSRRTDPVTAVARSTTEWFRDRTAAFGPDRKRECRVLEAGRSRRVLQSDSPRPSPAQCCRTRRHASRHEGKVWLPPRLLVTSSGSGWADWGDVSFVLGGGEAHCARRPRHHIGDRIPPGGGPLA
jgi:hypothetical protein